MHDELTPNRDDLDTLLDAALSTYTNPEPSLGLTPRILAATRAVDGRPPLRWMVWAVPALAAALAIVILYPAHHIYRDPSPSTSQLSGSASTYPITAPNPVKTGSDREAPRLRATATIRAAIPAPEPLPKQEVFPTPAPLSPQEQAIAALVNRNRTEIAKQVAQSANQDPEQPIEPLHIAAIHIPPLYPPDNGAN